MHTSDVAECPSTNRVAESQGATRVGRSLRLECCTQFWCERCFFTPLFSMAFLRNYVSRLGASAPGPA